MSKRTRTAIPREISDKVLDEYNHKCAICGAERPQLHHINNNPSDHDHLNLIPLCPNCHLTDQHNPTAPHDPNKMKLFRRFKDPAILSPQFHVLFTRLAFLEDPAIESDIEQAGWKARQLVNFIAQLQMGAFYSYEVKALVEEPPHGHVQGGELTQEESLHKHHERYRAQLENARDQVYSLAVELLRFQPWRGPAA